MSQADIEGAVVDTGWPHGVGIAETARHLGGRCEIEEALRCDGVRLFYAEEGIV